MTDKENAVSKVAEYIKIAETALENARRVADDAGINFSFNLGHAANVERRIGGEYFGAGQVLHEDDTGEITHEWGDNEHLEKIEDSEDEYGESQYRLTEGAWSAWQSSSEMC